MLRRGYSAPREDRGRRLDRAAADADGGTQPGRHFFAACRGTRHGGDLARDRGPDPGIEAIAMTKLQFRVLYREFLFRMVDLEVLSAHALSDANKLLGQFAALLIFISLWLSITAFGFAGSHMAPAARLAFTLLV